MPAALHAPAAASLAAFERDARQLSGRCDSDWHTRRSTTGLYVKLAGGAVVHASRRQHCITMSSCEAELVGLADTSIELIHTIGVLTFLGHEVPSAVEVCTDSKAAYDLCHRFTAAEHSCTPRVASTASPVPLPRPR